MSQGCAQVHKMYWGTFSGRKQGKIQPGVFLSVSWMSSVLHNCSDCNPVVFPPLTGEENVQRKQKFLEKQEFLGRQFFAPAAATMIYYVALKG